MADLIPDQYRWLLNEPGPKMLAKALELYGTAEVVGEKHNPIILDWADEVGLGGLYQSDEIPWCGLFVGVVAKRAGKPLPANPLWARNWAHWGAAASPRLGAVLVFTRESGGHVGLYVGEDNKCFHVLGGNQGNKVCIVRIEKDRLLAARELYKVTPANVRPVVILRTEEVSRNEA